MEKVMNKITIDEETRKWLANMPAIDAKELEKMEREEVMEKITVNEEIRKHCEEHAVDAEKLERAEKDNKHDTVFHSENGELVVPNSCIGKLTDDPEAYRSWLANRSTFCPNLYDPETNTYPFNTWNGDVLLINTQVNNHNFDPFYNNTGTMICYLTGTQIKRAVETRRHVDVIHFVIKDMDNDFTGVWDHAVNFSIMPAKRAFDRDIKNYGPAVDIADVKDEMIYRVVFLGGGNYVYIHKLG